MHHPAGKTLRVSALLAATLVLASCSKSIPFSESLTPVTPQAADANAGTWKMNVLTSSGQIPVAAPAAVTDPSYVAELATIRTAQAALTDKQKQSLTYWGAGGVLRWNETLRDLVARADLPPAPNGNGTYPVPDPANPFADPNFPFSNPPYAARAFSYISVAQYEALKAAWHFKYLYNRPSPAAADKGIQSLLPTSGIPSYPSEDGVEAGVNLTIMKALFPVSVDEITARFNDQIATAVVSGRATQSDVDAGVALGTAVAKVFLARAGTDGMKAAAGTPALWQALADAATARGEIPWISQDGPPRPPMLPVFGKVKAWNMTPANIVSERPVAPPSTSSAQMQTELLEVKTTLNTLSRDQLATVYKWADGVNTVTPPGHWNAIAVPYIAAAAFSEVRAARAFALLNMALHDAVVACWEAKYFYFNPRPSQLDPAIRTETGLPNFPSYVSGHSVFSAAAADVLAYLFPGDASTFEQQAEEAAMSRLYAGIHYRSDIVQGLAHGHRVAAYTVAVGKSDGSE